MPPPIPDNVCAANLKGASDVAVANFIAEYDACQTAECRALAIQHWHDAVLPRHSGEIEREPKPGGFDRKWSVPPAVRPTRDQLGNYLVRIEGEDARGLVVLAHESEMFTASASASATTTAPSTT